jgi:hypothetical protein
MTGAELLQSAVMWGPGILILAGIFILVRKPPEFIGKFLDAQMAQAVAMNNQATALKDMVDAVKQVAGKDDAIHQELMRGIIKLEINDIAILRELQWLRERRGGQTDQGV